jgi:hypothetical protein
MGADPSMPAPKHEKTAYSGTHPPRTVPNQLVLAPSPQHVAYTSVRPPPTVPSQANHLSAYSRQDFPLEQREGAFSGMGSHLPLDHNSPYPLEANYQTWDRTSWGNLASNNEEVTPPEEPNEEPRDSSTRRERKKRPAQRRQ